MAGAWVVVLVICLLLDRTVFAALDSGYIRVSPDPYWWSFTWHRQCWIGLFRNRPEVIPGRWGFYLFGIEVGSRNPGDKVGIWLKEHGLWPW